MGLDLGLPGLGLGLAPGLGLGLGLPGGVGLAPGVGLGLAPDQHYHQDDDGRNLHQVRTAAFADSVLNSWEMLAWYAAAVGEVSFLLKGGGVFLVLFLVLGCLYVIFGEGGEGREEGGGIRKGKGELEFFFLEFVSVG